jgi:hypothetical protein
MTTNHVNLLEPEAAGVGHTELNYLSLLIAVVILITGCLSLIGWQKYNLSIFTQRLDQITAEVNLLRVSASSGKKSATSSDALTKKVRPISWAKLLKKISQSTPPSIYLSQLAGAITEKQRTLHLMGNSKTFSAVLMFKDQLAKLPDCEKTTIININRTSFQIECHIK